MICGDKGHVTLDGRPCGQPINPNVPACIHHRATPEQRRLFGAKGAQASRMKRYMPATTPAPEFASTASIVTWAQETARQVLTGNLDPRAASEARQLAALTISARHADAQAALVDALLRLENGGAAVALLAQFTNGDKRKPLPGRVLSLRPPEGDPA